MLRAWGPLEASASTVAAESAAGGSGARVARTARVARRRVPTAVVARQSQSTVILSSSPTGREKYSACSHSNPESSASSWIRSSTAGPTVECWAAASPCRRRPRCESPPQLPAMGPAPTVFQGPGLVVRAEDVRGGGQRFDRHYSGPQRGDAAVLLTSKSAVILISFISSLPPTKTMTSALWS